MSRYYICDGCGKKEPAQGKWAVPNGWTGLPVYGSKHFCPECQGKEKKH